MGNWVPGRRLPELGVGKQALSRRLGVQHPSNDQWCGDAGRSGKPPGLPTGGRWHWPRDTGRAGAFRRQASSTSSSGECSLPPQAPRPGHPDTRVPRALLGRHRVSTGCGRCSPLAGGAGKGPRGGAVHATAMACAPRRDQAEAAQPGHASAVWAAGCAHHHHGCKEGVS